MPANDGTVVIENARLIFRNFEGKEGQYNREGDRNFGVIIPPEIAEQMLADGWNIKYLKPSEEEKEEGLEIGPPWLPVKVAYGKGAPPQITVIDSETGRRENFDESMVGMLDWAEIAVDRQTGEPKVDLIVRPYHYDVSGRQGISAYLKTMFVTIVKDPLQAKYAAMDAQTPPQ